MHIRVVSSFPQNAVEVHIGRQIGGFAGGLEKPQRCIDVRQVMLFLAQQPLVMRYDATNLIALPFQCKGCMWFAHPLKDR